MGPFVAVCLLLAMVVVFFLIFWAGKISETQKDNQIKSEEFERDVVASGFKIEKRIEHLETSTLFFVDNTSKKWALKTFQGCYGIFSYNDLLNYEIIENNESIAVATLNAHVFGGAFRTDKNITSVCSMMQIHISVDNLQSPNLVIPLVVSPVQKNSDYYAKALKDAHEIISTLDYILAHKTITD